MYIHIDAFWESMNGDIYINWPPPTFLEEFSKTLREIKVPQEKNVV